MPEHVFSFRNYWLALRERSPNWYIFWRLPGSRQVHRRSTGTNDLDTAKEALVALARGAQSARLEEPQWLSMTVVLDQYLEKIADTASFADARAASRRLADFCERNRLCYVSQFTPVHAQVYAKGRRRQIRANGHQGSNASINRELGVLRSAFRHAWQAGLLVDPPHVPLLPDPPPRDHTITARQCRQLLEACELPHLRLFVLLALFTLQRTSAILSLRVGQVDLVHNRIDFNSPGQSRTNKRRPVLPIPAPLWTELARAVNNSQTGYVVEYEGKPVASVRTTFRRAVGRAGLEKVSPNVLRHSGATLLAKHGVPMRQIAGMLGHSHVRTTERYAKHHPDYLSQAAQALEELLG